MRKNRKKPVIICKSERYPPNQIQIQHLFAAWMRTLFSFYSYLIFYQTITLFPSFHPGEVVCDCVLLVFRFLKSTKKPPCFKEVRR